MAVEPLTILVISIFFAAALMRSTFGFGEALVAMPLLTMTLGYRAALPLVALMSVANSFAILSTDWRNVQFGGAWRLALASLIGIPVGVYVFTQIPEDAVKLILGVLLIAFALYNLTRPPLWELQTDKPAYLFGFCAGVLGGAYNALGPPIVIYGTLRRWSPTEFRSTLQSVFLPTALAILATHWAHDLWTRRVFRLLAVSLPVILITVPLGTWLHRRIPAKGFSRYVFCLLLVIGATLVMSVLRGS